jgi:hypothetical protein
MKRSNHTHSSKGYVEHEHEHAENSEDNESFKDSSDKNFDQLTRFNLTFTNK